MAPRSSRFGRRFLIATAGLCALVAADEIRKTGTPNGWRQHDLRRPKPSVVEPAAGLISTPAPKDAVILFDGGNLDAWQTADGSPAGWKVADGHFEVSPGAGAIQTKAGFGDVQLHVEWASPKPARGKGQDRGNSGLFFMGRYEVQVLDSYQADTYADGQAGALYGQYPPLYNASKPPGEWQSYDIAFRRPRFDKAGKLLEPARVTLIHNGILVQNNEELLGQTNWIRWVPFEAHGDRAPISLQDHGHAVRFRNIWLRNLPERPVPTAKDLERAPRIELAADALDEFTGDYVSGNDVNSPKTTVSRTGGNLQVKFPYRSTQLVMEPIAPNIFDLPYSDGRFTFRRDDAGRVTAFHFQIADGERVMTKLPR